jgi:hypothetical protein
VPSLRTGEHMLHWCAACFLDPPCAVAAATAQSASVSMLFPGLSPTPSLSTTSMIGWTVPQELSVADNCRHSLGGLQAGSGVAALPFIDLAGEVTDTIVCDGHQRIIDLLVTNNKPLDGNHRLMETSFVHFAGLGVCGGCNGGGGSL